MILYHWISYSLSTLSIIVSTANSRSETSSALIVFLINNEISSSLLKKTPGESRIWIYLSSTTFYKIFVCPGLLETDTDFFLVREFITEDFPTLGYPMIPIVRDVLVPSTLEYNLTSSSNLEGPTDFDELIIFLDSYSQCDKLLLNKFK